MKFSWTNHTVTNIQEVNPDTLRECVFSAKPVMQQPVCSSTHHILSRLYPEPQLILMLSIRCGWWKIKHCWSPLCILPQRNERPLRGSRMTRQPCCLFPAFPQMHFDIHPPLILLIYEWPERIPVKICYMCGPVNMWNDKTTTTKTITTTTTKNPTTCHL